MAPGKVVREYKLRSEVSGPYVVEIVSGAVAEVELVTMTDAPASSMATAARGYSGTYSSAPMDKEEGLEYLKDVRKTKLATPTEMVHFLWLITGVTRAWTHQAVRYRVGTAFIQQSMRFLGYQGVYRVLCPLKDQKNEEFDIYCTSASRAIQAYVDMKDRGVADQDARGVLPTNILTALFWDMSLSTLMHVYESRMCCQAQGDEWLPILTQMREEITMKAVYLRSFLTAPIDRGEDCGFHASFDRPCVWKNRAEREREL